MWPRILLALHISISSNCAVFHFDNNACHHLGSYPFWFFSSDCYRRLDVRNSVPNMVQANNYTATNYSIVMTDGYHLTLYRIAPRADDFRKHKQPVFLQHGIATNCAVWVDVGNRSLAIQLADMGYDVWMGNFRGNDYSKGHEFLTTKDKEYWEFNLDAIAENDIRSSLRFVAKITHARKSIIYIGHSMGTTVMAMYASRNPKEAEELLAGMVWLSPVVYFDMNENLRPLMIQLDGLANFLRNLGLTVVFSHSNLFRNTLIATCTVLPYFCRNVIIDVLFGKSYQIPDDDLPVFFSYFPNPISVQMGQHFSQIHNSKKLQYFNYGEEGNVIKYGQADPPVYNLSKIRIPTVLYYGSADSLIKQGVVQKLYTELGTEIKIMKSVAVNNTRVETQFNHNDFNYAKGLVPFLYRDLFKLMLQIMSLPN